MESISNTATLIPKLFIDQLLCVHDCFFFVGGWLGVGATAVKKKKKKRPYRHGVYILADDNVVVLFYSVLSTVVYTSCILSHLIS